MRFETWPQILKAQTQFLKPWRDKEPVLDMVCLDLRPSWAVPATWILDVSCLDSRIYVYCVRGMLASIPAPAQTAVVQGMRPRAVPSVSIMDLWARPTVGFLIDPCSQVVVSTGVGTLIPETCASLLDPNLCAPGET